MKIQNIQTYTTPKIQPKTTTAPAAIQTRYSVISDNYIQSDPAPVSFSGNPLKEFKHIAEYLHAQSAVKKLKNYIERTNQQDSFWLRNYSMEYIEGLQYGIKVFKGLTMKEIQYLSENLHVIAVKRGCKNMCAHCYADAKPQNREMSWEDFTTITRGFKTLRKRFQGLDIYGQNNPVTRKDIIDQTTELFYDADCMDLAIKDKKGRVYDFTELSTELYESLGRRTAFDTSGWNRNNTKMQQRAEKYAEYFSAPQNMEKLNAFNLSINVFNASYVASRKAFKNGDFDKAKRLRERYVDNMANTIFTFTPLIENPKFHILIRSFDSKAQNAGGFTTKNLRNLAEDIIERVGELYNKDLNGSRKYIKSQDMMDEKMVNLLLKINHLDTSLNSSGRMKKFMEEFGIKAPLLEYDATMKEVIRNLKEDGRYHKYIMERLIDTDGKVYHMNYARFIPTEIQLNIPQKNIPSPKLANMQEDFVITKELINRPEVIIKKEV